MIKFFILYALYVVLLTIIGKYYFVIPKSGNFLDYVWLVWAAACLGASLWLYRRW